MILQIACRSGRPPSKIELEWSVDELRKAEALARLEGWGQDRRRTAELRADLHNISRIEAWQRCGDEKAQRPRMLSENDFLPRRVKAPLPISSYGRLDDAGKNQSPLQRKARALSQLSSVMNAMCGFG